MSAFVCKSNIGLEPTSFAMFLLVVAGYAFDEIEFPNYFSEFMISRTCQLVGERHVIETVFQ